MTEQEITGAFQCNAKAAQRVPTQAGGAAGAQDAPSAFYANAGYAKQRFIRGAVHFEGEFFGVTQRPAAFRVEKKRKSRVRFIEKLIGVEAIKAQQPIRLIKAMFPP